MQDADGDGVITRDEMMAAGLGGRSAGGS